MLKCPSCDTSLNQDFGMVTCQNCGAVLIVEISGEVRMSGETDQRHEGSVQPETENEAPSEENDEEGDFQNDFFESAPVGNEDQGSGKDFPESAPVENENQDSGKDFSNPEEELFDPEEGFSSPEEDEPRKLEKSESGFQEDFFESDPSGESIQNVNEFEPPKSSEDLNESSQPNSTPVDVSDFANSEESKLEEGEYLYDLTIGQMDSKETRKIVKSVLSDDRLKINAYEFFKKIKNGRLCVSNLNPVKAKIIVEQLQFCDLHIEWKQKRVVMEESLSPDEGSESRDGEFVSEGESGDGED